MTPESARAFRRHSPLPRCRNSYFCPTSGARYPTFARRLPGLQIVDPAEETFPFSGRVEFIEPEGAGAITAGRAETWRRDYEARVDLHRSEIRAQTDRSGWSFIVHRTDRPSTDLLLQLHARLSAGLAAFGADQRRGALVRPA